MTLEQLTKFGRWLRHRAEDVLVALLSIMFVTFIIQIFFRYVLNDPVGWTEEVIVTTWLWTVLWGAAFILSEAEEIRFDIIYSNISERVKRAFTIITGVALIFLYGISLPATYKYVAFMRVEHSAYLKVPIDLMYSVYVIFAVACIGRYCWLVYHAIRGGQSPQTDPAKVSD
ncbi:MAG: TRAP transporter small permease subunit [Pseudolabrys sp.]|nr:TRAP transporter small permease subunit [Pseudolabrys sp.]